MTAGPFGGDAVSLGGRYLGVCLPGFRSARGPAGGAALGARRVGPGGRRHLGGPRGHLWRAVPPTGPPPVGHG
eukprot:5148155-Lingulodinium_polyedra.AAC.1